MSRLRLLEPTTLGGLQLANRAVMAPMTRSRALGNLPNDLMATYYGQRADAGLIVTEGTSPTPHGLGYPRIPGIFSAEQIEGWRSITRAVHERNGKIFVQLMDTGRVAHPGNLPAGASVRGPSAVGLEESRMWVDGEGNVEMPPPRAMTHEEILGTVDAYAVAARKAMEAGFDGVELHGANGYLIEQFLNPHTNRREDAWGGTMEKRVEFVTRVAEAAADAIGADRVGLRVSPYGTFNEMPRYADVDETYRELARRMREIGLVYLHVIRPPAAEDVPADAPRRIAEVFDGTVIFAGDYDRDGAEAELAEGHADLIALGRPFLANPDLLRRFALDAELNEPDGDTFYAAGAEGYVDYETLTAPV